ncbi:MAG TPA: protein kinase [Gemmatimonadaceae bacterium]|nr:protein kinase [Gemmatimonadaceae bacterium]
MTTIPQLSAALGDRYRVEREIGAGGMATVYLARDLKHDREVALKVLRPDLAAVLGTERFLQEIRIAARLDHPHILTLIDSGAADGLLYYVLPYVRGESLRDRLAREKQLGIDDAVAITRQVGSALDYAHRQGVVHRDIKPENILLLEGEAMLTDFGIALAVREAGGNRLTESGTSLGTPQYMSPEQATGDRTLDARSDVYSLGAVLYEMLTGEPPHTGATVQAVIAKLITERPTSVRVLRDTVPDALDRAVTKALAKVPADRYQTAAEFVAALGTSTASPTASRRRTRRSAALGGAVLAMIAVLVLLAIRFARRGETGERAPAAAPVAYDRIQVTSTGHARWPILSPNGTELVYVEQTCTADGSCRNGLEVRDLASNVERELMPDIGWAYPTAYSRDGSWLLIDAPALGPGQPSGLYVMSRLGGPFTFVGAGRGDMTPAGDSVFVASAIRGQTALRFRTIALPVTQSVDSTRPTSTGQLGEIVDVRVAPDGRRVAVLWGLRGAENVLLAVYDRSGAIIDTTSVPQSAGFTLRWTTRARSVLVYVLSRRGEGALLRVAVDASGKLGKRDTLVVTPGERGASAFSVSADGHDLAFRISQAGQNLLWTMERQVPNAPPRPARLIRSASAFLAATLVKDGRTIVFGAGVPGPGAPRIQLFVESFEASGTESPRALTPALPDVMTWSPTLDGRRVIVETAVSGGRGRLTAYDVATARASPFADLPSTGTVAENGTDGIAFVDAAAKAIRLFDGTGHERGRLALPDTVGYPYAVAASPNADAYAFLGVRPDTESGEANARQAFYRISAATGRAQLIGWFEFGSERIDPFQWTADGSIQFGALALGESRPMLWRMPVAGGMAKSVSPLPFAPDPCACAISSDGRRWVGEVSHPVSDIYIIRNFDADSTP